MNFYDVQLSDTATVSTFTDDSGALCVRIKDGRGNATVLLRMPSAPPLVSIDLWAKIGAAVRALGYKDEVAA